MPDSTPKPDPSRDFSGSADPAPSTKDMLIPFQKQFGKAGEIFATMLMSSKFFRSGGSKEEENEQFSGVIFSASLMRYILYRNLYPNQTSNAYNVFTNEACHLKGETTACPTKQAVERLTTKCLRDLEKLGAFIEKYGDKGRNELEALLNKENVALGKSLASSNPYLGGLVFQASLLLYFVDSDLNPDKSNEELFYKFKKNMMYYFDSDDIEMPPQQQIERIAREPLKRLEQCRKEAVGRVVSCAGKGGGKHHGAIPEAC